MKIFWTVVIVFLVLIIGGIIFIYSGIYDVSAAKPENGFNTWLFSTVMDHSVARHAKGIVAPQLDDNKLIEEGFEHYSKMCVGCHGAPGVEPGRTSRNFNPQPPNLAEAVGDQSDANLFWIIKNGIKMTGMPGYGSTHSDDEIWHIVAFVRKLPKMDPQQYQQYKNLYTEPMEKEKD